MDLKVFLQDIVDYTIGVFKTMRLVDFIEIIVLAWFVYILIRFVRETRANQLLKGILIIFFISVVLQQLDQQLEFKVLGVFGETIVNVGAVALIVMFQPELRRVLEKMGRTNIVKSLAMNFESEPYKINDWIDELAGSCEDLSRKAIGALIIIERDIKLGEQIDTGTVLNAMPSKELLGNIFFPHTPLHDGAVIMRDGLILAAGCFLPKPQKEDLIPKELGSRHRAAIGLSEVSDAVVIVVSEETGTISTAKDGFIERGYDREKLRNYLINELVPAVKTGKKRKPRKPLFKNDDSK